MRVRRFGWAVAVAALAAVAGCSGPPTHGEVTGTVTVDGKPAPRGAVTFIPVDGKSQTAGGEIKDGRYTARVPLGLAKVEVRVPKVVGRKKLYDTPDSPFQDVLEEVLPDRYNNSTQLTLDVKPGKNEKDWDLKSR
jgi:hypothetical protein